MRRFTVVLSLAIAFAGVAIAQEAHDHGAPEQLGRVTFPNSCAPAVQAGFERGLALLHSFAYAASREAFEDVAKKDPGCAMAHWGVAMTYFHELWDPPIATESLASGRQEVELAQKIGAPTEREEAFIAALALMFPADEKTPHSAKMQGYVGAMRKLAAANPKDAESQVFYALALLAAASPSDKTHANQKEGPCSTAPPLGSLAP